MTDWPAITERDLASVGIASLGKRRERAEGEAERLRQWDMLLGNLLAVGAEDAAGSGDDEGGGGGGGDAPGGGGEGEGMLREIVEVVWREGLGSELAAFRQRLAHVKSKRA